ncbi:MAG: hypothetical protein U1F68_13575 [Gammaproteobacteria bacterium]
MAQDRTVLFTDLEYAAAGRDPQFVQLVLEFLNLPDPPPGEPEDPPEDYQAPMLARDAWTLERLRRALNPNALAGKTGEERKAIRRAAWEALLATPHPPPRLQLGKLLLALYQADDEPARALLLELIPQLPASALAWGVWQGIKSLYKQAERRHDLAMLGVLCYRLDTQSAGGVEVGRGTWLYMRRRAWRYLRQLGQALPELYPVFAGQVLRHYRPGDDLSRCWIIQQVWDHKSLIGSTDQGRYHQPQYQLERRAFADAWKLSAAPLLRLLEDAQHDTICGFAIRSLEEDFKNALRDLGPAWIARIGVKPLKSAHEFVIKLLRDNPEFHQSKLKQLGLHDMVLGLLASESEAARRYAIDYARAYATDLPVAELVKLATSGFAEAQRFAVALLEQRPPSAIGVPALLKLLAVEASANLAKAKLKQGFQPMDISAEQFLQLALDASQSRAYDLIIEFFRDHKVAVPAAYHCRVLDDPRHSMRAGRRALAALEKYPGREIGRDWLQRALLNPQLGDTISKWLQSGMLKGEDLDIEWLKGLVLRPNLRPLAFALLGDRELVAPARVGLPWLLALARQADPAVHDFAQRYLLEAFLPNDFGGAERLWEFFGGHQPESLRQFAARYLKAHHPQLGPTLAETRALGIKPTLTHADYSLARFQPLLNDERPDVRQFAVAIAQAEVLRWSDPELLYRLAASAHSETRAFAIQQLLRLGDAQAEPRLPLEWLLPERVFQLAESRHKAAREAALTLIRRHYDRIGGAARLAWLMESPEREVGLFAVRLLWERHRPPPTPLAWKPAGGAWQRPSGQFDAPRELRQFLRKTLFGLPPGRLERRESTSGDALPDRPWPASIGKQRLVETFKSLALEDRAFAELAVPVLEEFRHSAAKGEWQPCVAALVQIRRAHPALAIDLPRDLVPAGRARAATG